MELRYLLVIGIVLLAGCSGLVPQNEEAPAPPEDPKDPDSETDIEHYEVKQQIYDEFDIGTCFGMPTGVTEEQMKSAIDQNQKLCDKLKSDYNLTETSAIYNTLGQFQQISVEQTGPNNYEFTVRDGECCLIKTIHGTYNKETDSISVDQIEEENTPC